MTIDPRQVRAQLAQKPIVKAEQITGDVVPALSVDAATTDMVEEASSEEANRK